MCLERIMGKKAGNMTSGMKKRRLDIRATFILSTSYLMDIDLHVMIVLCLRLRVGTSRVFRANMNTAVAHPEGWGETVRNGSYLRQYGTQSYHRDFPSLHVS